MLPLKLLMKQPKTVRKLSAGFIIRLLVKSKEIIPVMLQMAENWILFKERAQPDLK